MGPEIGSRETTWHEAGSQANLVSRRDERNERWTALKQAEKRDDDGDDEVLKLFLPYPSAALPALLFVRAAR